MMVLAMTNVGVAAPIELLTTVDLKDGRYAVTFRQRSNKTRAFKHWTNIITNKGMGAVLAELPEAAREAWVG